MSGSATRNLQRSLWTLAVCVVGASFVQAQEAESGYRSLPFDEKFVIANRGSIRRILLTSEPLEGNEAQFDAYFQRGLFAQMTRPESLGNLADLREDFLKQYLRATKSDAVRRQINQVTLKSMVPLMRENFHPAVRHNAAMILGELDARPAIEFGTDKGPPHPLPEALPILVAAFKASALPDAVRVAAMIGIQRHLDYRLAEVPEAMRVDLTKEMIALVSAKQPPANRSLEGHDWMRRRGIEILAALEQPGGANEILTLFVSLAGDRQEDIAVRCTAAAAIGRLEYDDAVKFDMSKVAVSLGQLAIDAGRYEAAFAKSQEQLPSRRRLTHHLRLVKRGLQAPEKLAEANQQKLVASVKKPVDAVLAMLEDPATNDETLAANLTRVLTQLETALPAAQGPARTAPATPAAAPDPFSAAPRAATSLRS